MKKPRILLYDIETTPLITYSWDMYPKNGVAGLKTPSRILCAAYKWLGESEMHFVKGVKSEKPVVKKLLSLFKRADVIVAHNGDKFDNKRVKGAAFLLGYKPPSSLRSRDTLKVCKRHFNLPSYRLDYVCDVLGIGKKLKHTGLEMWIGCMAGKKEAWTLMEMYNRHDVKLLQGLYKHLKPWMDNNPGISIRKGENK